MDTVSKKRRSEIMGLVGHFDTPPEKIVRSILYRLGYRFRLHRKDLPGRPDVVLPAHRVAVFVHGCFWHRHPGCSRTRTPKTRVEFWTAKFDRNVSRDEAAVNALREMGWTPIVVWECETGDVDTLAARLAGEIKAAGESGKGTGPTLARTEPPRSRSRTRSSRAG